MLKFCQRLTSVLLALIVLLLSAPAFSANLQAPVITDNTNNLVGPAFLQNPFFLGASTCVQPETIANSINCVASGTGVVVGLCVSGGTLGRYAIAFDTITNSIDVNSRTNAITPAVLTSGNTSTNSGSGFNLANGAVTGCWFPPVPRRYRNGLTIAPSTPGTVSQWSLLLYVPDLTGLPTQ